MKLFRRRPADVAHGRPEGRWFELIDRYAPGGTFVDVGCMWRVNGEYAFHALERGASRVVGVDVEPATPEFDTRNAGTGWRIRFVQGDVNDPALAERIGRFDVVFCSGVLYHVPNPAQTIDRLRALCDGTLILTTAVIPELESPHGAVFFPRLPADERRRLSFYSSHTKVGVDTDFAPAEGYANWFWGMSPICVRAMLGAAGFEIVDFIRHRYVVTAVARPRAAADALVTHHGRPI